MLRIIYFGLFLDFLKVFNIFRWWIVFICFWFVVDFNFFLRIVIFVFKLMCLRRFWMVLVFILVINEL